MGDGPLLFERVEGLHERDIQLAHESETRRHFCHSEPREHGSCVSTHSWACQMRQLLLLRGNLASVDVWFKNAVGPRYFSQCTSHFVPLGFFPVFFQHS